MASLPAEFNQAKIDDINTIHEEFKILQTCVSAASESEDLDKDIRFGIHLELRRFDTMFSEFIDKVTNLIRCSKST